MQKWSILLKEIEKFGNDDDREIITRLGAIKS
jgi:hypothetical protein